MNPVRCIQVLDGMIINTVIADPTAFQPNDGSELIASPTGEIGDSYANGVVVPAAQSS